MTSLVRDNTVTNNALLSLSCVCYIFKLK